MNISRTCKTLIILFARFRKDAGPLAVVFGRIKKKRLSSQDGRYRLLAPVSTLASGQLLPITPNVFKYRDLIRFNQIFRFNRALSHKYSEQDGRRQAGSPGQRSARYIQHIHYAYNKLLHVYIMYTYIHYYITGVVCLGHHIENNHNDMWLLSMSVR